MSYTDGLDWNDEAEFTLDLPRTHGAYEYIARRYAQDGVQVTTPDPVVNRTIDRPLAGTLAVMPRDEREGKYGAPNVMLDFRPGRLPMAVVVGQTMSVADAFAYVNEIRHYEKPGQIDRDERPLDMNLLHKLRVEEIWKRRNGRKSFYMPRVRTTNWLDAVK